MAKEKLYTEVLNLRIDEAMGKEIKRIATQQGTPESEAARSLLEWGIEAHRAKEVAVLQLPYDTDNPTDEHGDPLVLKVRAVWTQFDPWEDAGP
jgi:hypothetical protein